MNKYYATQSKINLDSINDSFKNILKREEFLIYISQDTDTDIEAD